MALICPRCFRNLADSASDTEPPAFCRFCGQRLGSETATVPVVVMPDGGATVDAPTQSYDADGTPEEAPHPRTASEETPKAVGGYDLLRFLGAGGMGMVYEAENAETGHRVAVKLLSRKYTSNPTSVERFRQEGRVASQITHPHCVFVFRADADAGRPYIVMELMPGKTLKDLVDERGPLAVAEAVTRILDVVAGLAEAHRLGVIHRDVKPSNCFLTPDDRVKVGDFGLSKSLAQDQEGQKQITQSGAFLGTVLFASPEQIRGEPVGYESDVYAVCGTLYYLLTGRAPYQHESVTATLAKAVSEPPPPIRARRPDVPLELERVVLRGLERDRDRRWQSLDDLDDALRSQLPANQRPARPRSLVMAYLVDVLLLQLAIIPAQVLNQWAAQARNINVELFEMTWPAYVITFLYFILGEGVWGTTLGKKLLRLRVAKVGETGPPGLKAAAVRALVFNLMWSGDSIVTELLAPWVPLGAALAVAIPVGLVGLLLLLRQLWRSEHGYRGFHDFASGCRTIQRPRPPERVRLVSRFPSPLDRVQPTTEPLPGAVGGFVVKGKLCDLPDDGEVWLSEDRSLGRRVLVRVFPAGASDFATGDPVARPTRMRVVGHGTFVWRGGERSWIGYMAPSGAPLVDVVNPDKPLSWAETRPLIEQLTNELIASEADGSGVARPLIEQVWVEPGGRLQVLDFAVPCGAVAGLPPVTPATRSAKEPPVEDTPFDFVRRVASLAIEGHPRRGGDRIRAPIPPLASRILDWLFADNYRSLHQLQADLIENHAHPATVTAGLRAAHLGAQGPMLAVGLFVMFVCSGIFSFSVAVTVHMLAEAPADVRAALADPSRAHAVRQRVEALPESSEKQQMLDDLSPGRLPETLARLDERVESLRRDVDELPKTLNGPEQAVLRRYLALLDRTSTEAMPTDTVVNGLRVARADRAVPMGKLRSGMALTMTVPIVVWPFVWAAFAFAFRGGLAMHIAGLTLVRGDGRKAGRYRCALRELIVWLPLTLVLLVALWLPVVAPELVVIRTAVWFTGFLMLPLYVVIALKDPARPPQDRLVGTHLVPV
jgi:hypothetical protein